MRAAIGSCLQIGVTLCDRLGIPPGLGLPLFVQEDYRLDIRLEPKRSVTAKSAPKLLSHVVGLLTPEVLEHWANPEKRSWSIGRIHNPGGLGVLGNPEKRSWSIGQIQNRAVQSGCFLVVETV